MSSGSKSQTVGYRYFMGLHMGVCLGPVDALLAILSGDRVAWKGSQTASGAIGINAPELFGGEEREGGIQGTADVMMGEATQAPNAYLSSVQGTPQPAYRGLLSVVFRRGLIAANNPYIKPWAFKVRRILQGWHGGAAWYPEKAPVVALLDTSAAGTEYLSSLAGYSGISGNSGIFSPSSSPYGPGILAASQDDPTPAAIRREFSVGLRPTEFSFYFRSSDSAPDDACVISIEAGGATRFFFNPRREAGIDSARRAQVFFGGFIAFMGGVALASDVWYRLRLVWNTETTVCTATITNAATGAVVSSVSDISPNFLDDADSLTLTADSGGETCPTAFASFSASGATSVQSMNPAHIVYQCLTDPEWGMGYPTGIIDDASFRAAADTFHDEGLGLCLHWTQQQPIENFIQVVLDHAGAVMRQDPTTGLFVLKPLRADYDPNTLPVYDEANVIAVDSYDRPGLAEAVSEITVRYDDAQTGKSGSVTVQNLAVITAQGGVVSQPISYPGLPTAALAARVAMRDLRVRSTPLARVRLRINRQAYRDLPGDVIVLNWPKLGIDSLVLRIAKVNTGTLTSGAIEVDAVEDVFNLGANSYVAQAPIGWEEPTRAPTPIVDMRVTEAPFYELQRSLSNADLAALSGDEGYLFAAAGRPTNGALNFEVVTRSSGAASFSSAALGDFCPSATLAADLNHTATSATLANMKDLDLFTAGGYALIGDEAVRIDSIDTSTGVVTLGRGVIDTVAASHQAGALVLFASEINTSDNVERVDGESLDVRLLTRTGLGVLSELDASITTVAFDQRAFRPYPPGQLRIAGLAYPASLSNTVPTITWAHRNRLQQNLEGDESGNIGPEAGTTYSVELRNVASGALLASASGIVGTSYTPPSPPAGQFELRVLVWAVRGGLASMQRHDWTFDYELQTPFATLTAAASLIPGPAFGPDPQFANVVLLLRGDGPNGSTTFVDNSASPKTISISGGTPTISTAQSKFGGSSILLPATLSHLSLPAADFQFATGATFTVEFFIRLVALPASGATVISMGAPGAGPGNAPARSGWAVSVLSSGAVQIAIGDLGLSLFNAATITAGLLAAGSWYHVAVVVNGSTVPTIYIDGVARTTSQFGAVSWASVTPTEVDSSSLFLGKFDNRTGTPGTLNAFIDELRVTRNFARYTANFTPPIAPFPTV